MCAIRVVSRGVRRHCDSPVNDFTVFRIAFGRGLGHIAH
jgi:hypothetical protein